MDNDGLIGVDPDDERQVLFGGATFTVGPIPADIWAEMTARRSIIFTDAHRRVIKILADKGEDPAKVVSLPGKPTRTAGDEAVFEDPEFHRRMAPLYSDGAKFGVKSHTKFLDRKGQPIPLAHVETVSEGVSVRQLGEVSMRYYRLNMAVCQQIFTALYELNELGPIAKKV